MLRDTLLVVPRPQQELGQGRHPPTGSNLEGYVGKMAHGR